MFHYCKGVNMFENNESYIRLVEEKGRISVRDLASFDLSQVRACELHHGQQMTANQLMDLARAMPNLLNLTVWDKSGTEQHSKPLYELKLFEFIKNCQRLNQFQAHSNNVYVKQALMQYQQSLAELLAAKQDSTEVLCEIVAHQSLTLSLFDSMRAANEPATVDHYMKHTERLLSHRQDWQWYQQATTCFSALVMALSLVAISTGLACIMTMPAFVLSYIDVACLMPILMGVTIGSVGYGMTASEADYKEKAQHVFQAAEKVGLMCYQPLFFAQPERPPYVEGYAMNKECYEDNVNTTRAYH